MEVICFVYNLMFCQNLQKKIFQHPATVGICIHLYQIYLIGQIHKMLKITPARMTICYKIGRTSLHREDMVEIGILSILNLLCPVLLLAGIYCHKKMRLQRRTGKPVR